MKKTIYSEQAEQTEQFFEDQMFNYQPLARVYQSNALQGNPTLEKFEVDKLMSGAKWLFSFLPGAAAIHFISMGIGLFLTHQDGSLAMLRRTLSTFGAGMFLVLAVGTFLVMFGLGKLTDLKYLKVAGAISAVSVLIAMAYSFSLVTGGDDFFGVFVLAGLPLSIFAGCYVKTKIDEEAE